MRLKSRMSVALPLTCATDSAMPSCTSYCATREQSLWFPAAEFCSQASCGWFPKIYIFYLLWGFLRVPNAFKVVLPCITVPAWCNPPPFLFFNIAACLVALLVSQPGWGRGSHAYHWTSPPVSLLVHVLLVENHCSTAYSQFMWGDHYLWFWFDWLIDYIFTTIGCVWKFWLRHQYVWRLLTVGNLSFKGSFLPLLIFSLSNADNSLKNPRNSSNMVCKPES